MNEAKNINKDKTLENAEDSNVAMKLEKLKFEVAQEFGFGGNENNKKE